MVNFEPLKVALFDWLHAAVNTQSNGTVLPEGHHQAIPVIRAEDDQIRPDGPFIEYKFLTGLSRLGTGDEMSFNNTDDTFIAKGQREITVSVNVLGTGAQEILATLQNSLSLVSINDGLRAAGLSVRQYEAIADVSVFQETKFEERAVLDVIFGLVLTTPDTVGRIESVEITSSLPGGTTEVVEIP